MTQINTYQPSGLVGRRAFLVATLVGAPLAASLGWALAWIDSYIDNVYIWSFVFIAYALLIGAISSMLAGDSHSRNPVANVSAATALLVVLIAVRWWQAEQLPSEALWSRIQTAPFSDIWLPLTGAVLEAMFIGLNLIEMARVGANTPYSEAKRQWAEEDLSGELWTHAVSLERLKRIVEEQGAHVLAHLYPAQHLLPPSSGSWMTLKVKGVCVQSDVSARWIDVELIKNQRLPNNSITTVSQGGFFKLVVTDELYQTLKTKLMMPRQEYPVNFSQTFCDFVEKHRIFPTELKPAVEAMAGKDFEMCLAIAKLYIAHDDTLMRADALRLCAQAHKCCLQWPEADEMFEHLFNLEPTAFNALQVSNAAIKQNDLAKGEAWFETALKLRSLTPFIEEGRLRTAYLSTLIGATKYSESIAHLNALAQTYIVCYSGHDHQMIAYGVPQFSEFLCQSHEVMRKVLDEHGLANWYQSLENSLHPDARIRLEEHMAKVALTYK